VLATLADVAGLREEIRRVRARTAGSPEQVERALVSARVLRDLADASQANSGAVPIVGTLWPNAAYDRAGGILDRLGITRGETAEANEVLDGRRALGTVRAITRVDTAAADVFLADPACTDRRPILLGGLDLLRWGLARRATSNDLIYEVHGVGRLSLSRLTWWFQRVRGLEFANPDAIERIHQKTGGLPLLLDVVDNQLASVVGTTVSDERVALALGTVDEALPRVASDLAAGRPSIALSPREREILQIVEHVVRADASAGHDIKTATTEFWELYADKCSLVPLGTSDSLSIELLLETGLLPTLPSPASDDPLGRVGTIVMDDPALRLVRASSGDRRDG